MNSENLAAIFSFFSTTEDIIRQCLHYLDRDAPLFNLKSCYQHINQYILLRMQAAFEILDFLLLFLVALVSMLCVWC